MAWITVLHVFYFDCLCLVLFVGFRLSVSLYKVQDLTENFLLYVSQLCSVFPERSAVAALLLSCLKYPEDL